MPFATTGSELQTFIGCAYYVGTIFFLEYLRRRKRPNEFVSPFPDNPFSEELLAAVDVALLAGENIAQAIDKTKDVENKSQIDFVTSTDIENEKIIFEALRRKFPSHQFIGEVRSTVIQLVELSFIAICII